MSQLSEIVPSLLQMLLDPKTHSQRQSPAATVDSVAVNVSHRRSRSSAEDVPGWHNFITLWDQQRRPYDVLTCDGQRVWTRLGSDAPLVVLIANTQLYLLDAQLHSYPLASLASCISAVQALPGVSQSSRADSRPFRSTSLQCRTRSAPVQDW